MKKIFIVLFLSLTLIGCKGGESVVVASETRVTIKKSVVGYTDPIIVIACKNANFNGETVIARGIVSITGSNGGIASIMESNDWAVPMIEVHEDQVIIQIPSKERQYYTITIEKL